MRLQSAHESLVQDLYSTKLQTIYSVDRSPKLCEIFLGKLLLLKSNLMLYIHYCYLTAEPLNTDAQFNSKKLRDTHQAAGFLFFFSTFLAVASKSNIQTWWFFKMWVKCVIFVLQLSLIISQYLHSKMSLSLLSSYFFIICTKILRKTVHG